MPAMALDRSIIDQMNTRGPTRVLSTRRIVFLVVAGALGYRSVDLSAKVLGALMALEVAVLVVLDLAVIIRDGRHALPLTSFAPSTVLAGGLSGGIGLLLMFAYVSFVGFESAAL